MSHLKDINMNWSSAPMVRTDLGWEIISFVIDLLWYMECCLLFLRPKFLKELRL